MTASEREECAAKLDARMTQETKGLFAADITPEQAFLIAKTLQALKALSTEFKTEARRDRRKTQTT